MCRDNLFEVCSFRLIHVVLCQARRVAAFMYTTLANWCLFPSIHTPFSAKSCSIKITYLPRWHHNKNSLPGGGGGNLRKNHADRCTSQRKNTRRHVLSPAFSNEAGPLTTLVAPECFILRGKIGSGGPPRRTWPTRVLGSVLGLGVRVKGLLIFFVGTEHSHRSEAPHWMRPHGKRLWFVKGQP